MSPPRDRIVVDPDQLRRLAHRMIDAAEGLSRSGRWLVRRPLPQMPSGITALVTQMLAKANVGLQDLGAELADESTTLSTRAAWAEAGEVGSWSWLLPGIGRLPQLAPGSVDGVITGLPPHDDRWATELLGPPGSTDASSDPTFGASIEAVVDEVAPDIGRLSDLVPPAVGGGTNSTAGLSASAALRGLDVAPTVVGLIGCIEAGTGSEDAAR